MKKASFRKLSVSFALLVFVFQFGTAFAQKKPVYKNTSGKSTTYYYVPDLMKSLDDAKQELKTAFTRKFFRVGVYDWERPGALHLLKIKNTLVFDNRLEFILKKGDKRTLYFKKLFGPRWVFFKEKVTTGFVLNYSADISYNKSYYHVLVKNSKRQYDTLSIFQPVYITRKQYDTMDHISYVDAFYTVEAHMVKYMRDSIIQVFKPEAEKYRALEVKPAMSEEQRKYVVQANYYTNQKKYLEAIKLLEKVIKINHTSYPDAYYNIALLYGQINNPGLAIFYMRCFLLLEPDTKEARAGQDKIYEWDLKVNKLQK